MLNSIVRINKNLKLGQVINGCEVKSAMLTYKNRLAEVISVDFDGTFKLDITGENYIWHPSMVTVVAKKIESSDSIIYKLNSIVSDLGNVEETNDPRIDSYIDSAIKTAKEILEVIK